MASSSDSDEDQPMLVGTSRWQRRRRKRLRSGYEVHISDNSEDLDSPPQSPVHVTVQQEDGEVEDSSNTSVSEADEDAAEVIRDELMNPEHAPDDALDDDDQQENSTVSDEAEVENHISPPVSESDADDSGAERGNGGLLPSEESDYSDENLHELEDDETLLYPNAHLTVHESLMSVLTLAIRHSLTGKCISDILEIIYMHCPPNSACIRKLHKYKQYFAMVGNSSLKLHYYCSTCVYPLDSKDSVCGNCDGTDLQSTTFFIEVPLQNQLQAMLKREGFYNDLQHRFQRVKKNQESIEDVYDGEMYKTFFQNGGFLSDPNHISLMWYSDGVAVYNSSNFQIWPLCFTINELSPKKRRLQENVILGGLWFGSHKPNPNLFLRPFHTVLSSFCNEGLEFQVNGHPQTVIRGMLLNGVADLPAKSTFLNFKNHNGRFGCVNCVAQGERYDLGNATVQVYPYSPNIQLRKNDDIQQFAVQATELKERDPKASVFGVKGPTLLYHMVPNMVRGTGIDKMHAVDNGVAKQIIHLMFDSVHCNEPYSIRPMIRVVDERLSKIKPPSFVQRIPHSIEHQIAFWKSQVYRDWLMYYSIPVLFGILDDQYFRHHCYLVSAIYILTQPSISFAQINAASELLHLYVSEFQDLYSLRYLGMNIHQLLHLAQAVKDLGPLWVTSCYSFEDLNGRLAKLIHGSRYAGMQVCSAASTYLNLPVMIRELPEASPARKFCERLNSNVACVRVAEEIAPAVYIVGNFHYLNNVENDDTRQALRSFGIEGGTLKYFHRLRRYGVMYYSSTYPRSLKKESSYIQFIQNNALKLGRIIRFIRWSDCGPNCPVGCTECPVRYFVAVKLYEREPWHIHTIPLVRLPYLNKVVATDIEIVFPIDSLDCLCFFIPVDNDMYMAVPVTNFDGN